MNQQPDMTFLLLICAAMLVAILGGPSLSAGGRGSKWAEVGGAVAMAVLALLQWLWGHDGSMAFAYLMMAFTWALIAYNDFDDSQPRAEANQP